MKRTIILYGREVVPVGRKGDHGKKGTLFVRLRDVLRTFVAVDRDEGGASRLLPAVGGVEYSGFWFPGDGCRVAGAGRQILECRPVTILRHLSANICKIQGKNKAHPMKHIVFYKNFSLFHY